MAFYYGPQHHQASNNPSHNHHGGRSRRAPRLSSSQNSHRQFRGVRSMKELTEAPMVSASRARFEAMRSFELDDDLEFCPSLLSEDDLQSIASSSSDRSSLSSGSPSSSPLQHQTIPATQVSPPYSLAQTYQPTSSYPQPSQQHQQQLRTLQQQQEAQIKIHQPSALRTRNAIPIVNPSTGLRMSSPPQSISPARMQQQTYARRW